MKQALGRILPSVAMFGVMFLSGCASGPPAPVVDMSLPGEPARVAGEDVAAPAAAQEYRVQAGDTLYSIAFRHGLDYRDLAAWNGIGAPYRIDVGQRLRLAQPAIPAAAMPTPGQAVTSAVAASPATTRPLASGAAVQPSPFEPVDAVPAPVAPTPAPAIAPTHADAAPARSTAEPSSARLATPPESATVAASAPSAAPAPIAATPPAAMPPSAPVPQLQAGGVAWRWPVDGKVIGSFVSGDPTRQGLDIAGKAGDPVRAAAAGEVVYSGNGLIGYGELVIVKHNANFLSAYGHNRKRLVKEGDKVAAGQQIAEMGSSSATRDELHFEIRKNGKPVNPLDYLPAR